MDRKKNSQLLFSVISIHVKTWKNEEVSYIFTSKHQEQPENWPHSSHEQQSRTYF